MLRRYRRRGSGQCGPYRECDPPPPPARACAAPGDPTRLRQSVRNSLIVEFPYGSAPCAEVARTACKPECPTLTIGPDRLPEAAMGEPYEIELTSDGEAPVMWTLRQGPGYLGQDGIYRWDEPDAEIVTLEVHVRDARGLKGQRTFSLVIHE